MKPTAFYARGQKSEVRGQTLSSLFLQSTAFSLRSASVFRPTVYSLQPTVGGLRAAFTLIELLVVMVIATVIMAVSLPAFIGMGRGAGMRTAVNNVRSTVALSRQWAITHREEITFVASSTGMVYTTNNMIVPATNDHACYYAVSAEGALVQSITELPLDVRFGDPNGTPKSETNLIFHTDGGLGGATTVFIKLVDKKSMISGPVIEKTISINELTGGIRVQ